MKKTLALLLALLMVFSMVATAAAEGEDEYTLHLSMTASPINWNPHAWEMSNRAHV